MADYDELVEHSAKAEERVLERHPGGVHGILDKISIGIGTVGVGYLPIAPGTWGSAVGVVIYLFAAVVAGHYAADLAIGGWTEAQIAGWSVSIITTLFVIFCLAGIWASTRVTRIFGTKDPSHAVVDEVMGQLITFMFIPFTFSWQLILAGFLLFRLFDIWKPYPIDSLQNLPAGLGVCADDIVAGVYAGICLSILYAVTITL
ncbi:MAG: phosphatidylglycerophosphatase A [Blastocatellia bacterium]|nr:phosphatidylglycerophosphatase A [Blastocatellia bacterium]